MENKEILMTEKEMTEGNETPSTRKRRNPAMRFLCAMVRVIFTLLGISFPFVLLAFMGITVYGIVGALFFERKELLSLVKNIGLLTLAHGISLFIFAGASDDLNNHPDMIESATKPAGKVLEIIHKMLFAIAKALNGVYDRINNAIAPICACLWVVFILGVVASVLKFGSIGFVLGMTSVGAFVVYLFLTVLVHTIELFLDVTTGLCHLFDIDVEEKDWD